MIPEDRVADPEAYRDGKHFFEGDVEKGLQTRLSWIKRFRQWRSISLAEVLQRKLTLLVEINELSHAAALRVLTPDLQI